VSAAQGKTFGKIEQMSKKAGKNGWNRQNLSDKYKVAKIFARICEIFNTFSIYILK